MITVDVPEGRRAFPALDFKFQNVGHATAVMWKFGVVIEHAEIDSTPELRGYASVRDIGDDFARDFGRYLQITIANDGWGPALDGNFTVAGSRLDELLEPTKRRFFANIASGSRQTFLVDSHDVNEDRLTKLRSALRADARKQMDNKNLQAKFNAWVDWEQRRRLSAADADSQRRYSERDPHQPFVRTQPEPIDETVEFKRFEAELQRQFESQWGPERPVPLGEGRRGADLYLQYKVKDRTGKQYEGNLRPDMGGNTGLADLAVSTTGFSLNPHFVDAMVMAPDTVYCTVIDVDRKAHVREYPISRQIPPGDAENFQIVVGATKSAHLRIKLRFYVDKNDIIESMPFDIEIWNPRNEQFHTNYVDGDQIFQNKMENRRLYSQRRTHRRWGEP